MLTSFVLKIVNHNRKVKLFQLAMLLIAVVALASNGSAKIHYFEDFEDYDKGYDISNEVGWKEHQNSKPFVDSGVSMLTQPPGCSIGNKSITTEPLGDGDYGMFLYFHDLGLPLNDTSVLGFWAMRGPGWEVNQTSEVIYVRYQDIGETGMEYGLSLTEDNFFQYKCEKCGSMWVKTDIRCEPDTWYRVMWVATGASVDLYVDDTLLYSSTDIPNLSILYLVFIRYDTRVDNVFIADSISDIKACAVAPEGKLATTWGDIKAE